MSLDLSDVCMASMSFESKTQGIHLGNSSRLQFSCTIDHDRIPCFCDRVEPRISYSSFTPRGGIKYQVFDIPLLPFFASICTASILAASSLALCGTAFEFHRRHGGSSARAPIACIIDGGRDIKQCEHRQPRVDESDNQEFNLIESPRPTQTKRTTGRYSTW